MQAILWELRRFHTFRTDHRISSMKSPPKITKHSKMFRWKDLYKLTPSLYVIFLVSATLAWFFERPDVDSFTWWFSRVIFWLPTQTVALLERGNPSNLPYVHLLLVWSPQKWVPFNDPWRIPVLSREIYLGHGQKGNPYHRVAAQLRFPILPTTPNVTPPEIRG